MTLEARLPFPQADAPQPPPDLANDNPAAFADPERVDATRARPPALPVRW